MNDDRKKDVDDGAPDVNNQIDQKNISAWDSLYASTKELVWGEAPVFVINKFLEQASSRLPQNAKLLDAAAGEGRNIGLMLDIEGDVTACDASGAALAKIPERYRNKIETVICRLSKMPFETDTFDFVLAWDIIETLPNPESALKEMNRVLKTGGLLLCNIPGFEDGISALDMISTGEQEYLYRGRYFFRFMEKKDAVALLTEAGYEIEIDETAAWTEKPHAGYRDQEHTHTSNVFLAKKK